MLVVHVSRSATIDTDELYALYPIIRANMPTDCDKTDREIMRQVIDIAAKNLRDSDVYDATFNGDGSNVRFVKAGCPAYVEKRAARA